MSAPRRGHTSITVFGRRAVLDALAEPGVEVLGVRVSKDVPGSFTRELKEACASAGVELETVSRTAMTETTRAPKHDQGVAAGCVFSLVSECDEFLDTLKGERAKRPMTVVALDGITNPQNVGMIIRSGVASGIDGLLWPLKGSPWIGGLVIKASASMIYRLPVIRCETLEEGIASFQGAGFEVAGLESTGATALPDHSPPHRGLYVIGGETVGISAGVRSLLDTRLRIPMAEGVESLNAAAAATLLCYHATGLGRPRKRQSLTGVD